MGEKKMESSINKYSHISREIIIETDCLGIITFVTQNCSRILGFEHSEFINTDINNYIKCDFNNVTNNPPFQREFIRKNGDVVYFDILISPNINSKNQSIGFTLSLIYVDRYEYTEEIDSKFNKLFENTKDVIFKLQLIPKPSFTFLSPSVKNIFGYSLEDYFQNPLFPSDTVHPDDYEIQLSKCNKDTDFSGFFHVRFKHKDGYYVWIEDYIIPTFNGDGELVCIEGISRDITKRKALEFSLEKLSYVDGLTGLYNRTYLNKQIEILNELIDIPIAIIVCDLDNLKYFNDTFGHSRGDILLKNVGSFLSDTFNEDSIIIRNGGDEFIIILTDFTKENAEGIYSNMLLSINKYNDTHEFPIYLSSGFSYSSSSKTILDLLITADKNMYNNKYEKKKLRTLTLNERLETK
jgi:diguanylate cyclase (GGDEF)-like protein/PAS domain S-box-containing protein